MSHPTPPLFRIALFSSQVHRLRNEQSVYESQYPERVQLLLNMGFEWDHTAVPDEWELIILGEIFFWKEGRKEGRLPDLVHKYIYKFWVVFYFMPRVLDFYL